LGVQPKYVGISVKNIVVRAWLRGGGHDPTSGCNFM